MSFSVFTNKKHLANAEVGVNLAGLSKIKFVGGKYEAPSQQQAQGLIDKYGDMLSLSLGDDDASTQEPKEKKKPQPQTEKEAVVISKPLLMQLTVKELKEVAAQAGLEKEAYNALTKQSLVEHLLENSDKVQEAMK